MSDQGKDGQGDPWARWRKPAESVAAGGERALPKAEAPAPAVEPAATVEPPAAPEKLPGEPLGTLSVRKRVVAPRVEKPSAPRGAKEGRAPSSGFKGDRKPGTAGRSAPPRRDDGKPAERKEGNPWGRSAATKPARAVAERENPWAKRAADVPSAAKPPEAPKGPPPEGVRLSKVMSERGLCSRREADLWIERGWVFVDGEQVSELGSRIDPVAKIEISTEAKKDQAKAVTILIHKPVGYVSSQPEPGCIPAVTLITPEAQVVQSGDPEFKPWMLRGLAPDASTRHTDLALLRQALDALARKRHGVSQGRGGGPAGVGEALSLVLARALIAGQHVEVDVLVDHHQHQVVDLLVVDLRLQKALNARHGDLQVGEGGGTHLGERLDCFLAHQDQRPKCRLLRTDQNQPVIGLRDLGAGIAERQSCGIGHEKAGTSG